MSDFTNQLKSKADIVRIIGEFVALKPGGNGAVGLCPFHGEKTPSFHVHAAKQFFYCFGCHVHGDVYAFLMQLRKVSFQEAVELLAERLGVEVPRGSDDGDPQRRELLRVHEAAARFFTRSLEAPVGARARAYLQERDLKPAAVTRFQLGYAPENGRALALFLESEGFNPDLAVRAGVCQARRESGETLPAHVRGWADVYDRFRHRLMFPIADERGRVIAFGGRALASDVTDANAAKTPKYLNSPESVLYTKGKVLYNLDRARAAIRELGYVILVEGYFDCIRVFDAGFENVVASCGTALTAAQIAPVARVTKKALVNFDPDAAGAAAAERSIGMLLEEGFQMRVVVLANGLDPDLFLRQQGREAYAAALKQSRSFFDYLAERARQRFDLRRGEGKVEAINHLLPYLSHIHDPILRQNLAENVAAQLGIDQPLISQQLLRAARERQAKLPASKVTAPEMLPAERIVMSAWLNGSPELGELLRREALLEGLAAAPLAQQLWDSEGHDWQAMAEALPETDRRLVAELLLAADAVATATVEDALGALRERQGREAIRRLQVRIAAAAQARDMEQVKELSRQKAEWDSRLRTTSQSPQLESPTGQSGGHQASG
jgi:DNA primase